MQKGKPEDIKAVNIIRILDTDLDGNMPIFHALLKVNGISFSMANAICTILNIDKTKKAQELTSQDYKQIEDLFENPEGKIPLWMLNRQRDPETGVNKHLITTDLKMTHEFDIKMLKKIKSYRGLRHAQGQPCRGQRTKSHFRKGTSLGVKKVKVSKKN
ncbi:MAG: 30S ribosomal protein S13 [Candidatus Nanoarchaeia archaeon]|nr:30S ribosomal protein S13 [Candidatus Nanoarchaeia archaeon]MDD5588178.1 30S ribosomal protein S13 [Candidatus Nanoarchaeia archaeon]